MLNWTTALWRGACVAALGSCVPAMAAAQQPAGPSAPTLELSMEQAVTMSLETNLGLKADRLEVAVASENVAIAQGAFRPLLRSTFQRNTADRLPQSFVEGNAVVSSGTTTVGSTVSQNLSWYGGAYSVNWQANRGTTTAALNPFNPQLGSGLTLAYQQPLWRNLRIDQNRYSLQAAQRTRTIADLTLEERIAATRNAVQQAYLNLVGANEALKVAQQNMDLATENLKNFRARVAVGVSADIDVIQAEAQVASNEEQLIVSEAAISTAEDALRALIVDPKRPDFWRVHLTATDPIVATPRQVDVEAAIGNALQNRLDLQVARRQHEITSLTLTLDENTTKPDVTFGLNYGAQGLGGTQLIYGEGFPPPITNRIVKGFASVLNDTFTGAYPSWTASVNFSYPLGLSPAKATLARTRVQQRQEDLQLQDLELQVASQVRNAGRDVQTNFKRVEATQKARQAIERQLDAEERKFGVGLSTSFELQQRQRDLAQARVQELNAIIAYNRSLIAFERVQKIQ